MWNKKHNDDTKVSGHTYTKNWKIVELPIKVHPSDMYCNSGGIDCQYLRYKDDERKHPVCAWNFEYRGHDYGEAGGTAKKPLHFDEKQGFVVKAAFCRSLTVKHYGNKYHTWENTTKIGDANQQCPDNDGK